MMRIRGAFASASLKQFDFYELFSVDAHASEAHSLGLIEADRQSAVRRRRRLRIRGAFASASLKLTPVMHPVQVRFQHPRRIRLGLIEALGPR